MNMSRFVLLASLIVAGVGTRLIPHPPNVTAVGALALFTGAMFRDRRVAIMWPLLAMLVSDLFIGLHILVPVVYGSFAVNVLISRSLASSRKILGVSAALFIGAIQFFVVTNFACWIAFYPSTGAGFVSCYVNAIPHLLNSLIGDAGYAVALFGAVWLAEKMVPSMREQVQVDAAFARV